VTNGRRPHFTVMTPYAGAPKVVCWEDAWNGHIAVNGRATFQNRLYSIVTLEAPTIVLAVHKDYIMFVSENQRSVRSGSPFGVVVDPKGNPLPAVASIGFRRELSRYINRASALWLPPIDS
jgi:hypothetical protein